MNRPPPTSDIASTALAMHARYRGKIQVVPKCPARTLDDMAIWYTPGVAAPCLAIRAEPARAFELTNRGNTIAIVTDGSRVLGLGNLGGAAALPVMEGKALLFKLLGGVDAVPICLDTQNDAEIIRTVEAIAPSFGGVNLEDIAQPRCFGILDALRARLAIPVWHDDQQGSALVVLAGLMNALRIVEKRLAGVRIALIGVGAANVAVYRLLCAAGVHAAQIVACDSRGILHPGRQDIAERRGEFAAKWALCTDTNPGGLVGGIAEALAGADVCIAFSQAVAGTIRAEWVARMARDAIVFACANPIPEIQPADALAAGARVVGTGRSDAPNQVNNALAFPGVFRGVLDVRARAISDAMAIAAAEELAACVDADALRAARVLPTITDPRTAPRVALAVALAAQREGLAQRPIDPVAYLNEATARIEHARAVADALASAGLIAPRPD